MMDLSDIEDYLPRYLSKESVKGLFEDLKQFPANIDSRLYSSELSRSATLYQGDGLSLPLSMFPGDQAKEGPVMMLSNTCDIDSANERLTAANIVYAGIINYSKYENMLIRLWVDTGKKSAESIQSHLALVKKQRVSHMFYLPKGGELAEDSIAVLDIVNSALRSHPVISSCLGNKLFTLSNYGFYLFLFKLSVHFCRVKESVERNQPDASSGGFEGSSSF